MTGLVDVHAHLASEAFSNDLDEVLGRAREAGVAAVVAVGETLDEAGALLGLGERHPGVVLPCAGLFPTILDLDEARAVIELARANRDRLAGIGEVGLDLWKVRDEDGRRTQAEIFLSFIRLAAELDLPLNVHSRSAGRETIELLLRERARRVNLHAFDGRAATAAPAVEAGWFFSVPPSIVRSRQKQKLFRRLPLESLLLETDSPVLGPDPVVRNEPANLRVALDAVAAARGVPAGEVEAAVVANQRRWLDRG